MKEPMVLLSIDEYDSLRDFKKNIENKNTYEVVLSKYMNLQRFVSESEAVRDLTTSLNFEIESHNNEINILLKDISDKNRIIDNLKSMSFFEFIKWKKKSSL